MDWIKWHTAYDSSPALASRLNLVRANIAAALAAQPAGPVQLLSLCAGDGRDVIGALAAHPRAPDVQAHLVEINPELAAQAQAAAEHFQLQTLVHVHCADASLSDTYSGLAAADIVLAAGVFGNLRPDSVASLIAHLPCLARRGATVIWTRLAGDAYHLRQMEHVRACLAACGFAEQMLAHTEPDSFVVGVNVFTGETLELQPGAQWFEFVGYDLLNASQP